ncbi:MULTISPECIES: NAD(P)/FAD-dependent oxidoreductase [Noviherbaspirillum]|uniref:NAD(P)/FAD-dependent oxidoreductase n=1 Tax=Noviherbaspirillum TaxID=1344552 RepID=UPI00124D5DBF|nr:MULTISPECIES: FAD-dependent oxidoreductase [Noviherbaspirillum]
MSQQTIVVVGAGQAGAWAARTLRNEGFAGHVVLVGYEAHPPYERPPLSKEQLQPDPTQMDSLLSAAEMADLDIDWLPSLACVRIDRVARQIVLSNDETIGYDKLILATGGIARVPPLPGIDAPCVHTLRTLDDAQRLRSALKPGAHLLVIGGGWIGLEVAASARQLGCNVTLVESGATLCGRTGSPALSAYLTDLHASHGVDLRLSSGVAALENTSSAGCRAVLADGSSVNVHLVVVGIGLIQNDAVASQAGLECDHGVIVDRQCRTSDPDIFAAGDVTAMREDQGLLRLESWQNAQDQGIAAARAVLGQAVDYRPVPYFWSQQYDTMVQLAGRSAPGAIQVTRGDASRMMVVDLTADGRVLSAIVANNPRDFRTLRKFVSDGTRIDAGRFADPAMPLAKLAIAA